MDFSPGNKKAPSPFCPGWTEKTKEQPSAVPLFLRFQNDGNALCGYGPAAWPAGYPCVANGRNPVRAYLLRHGRSAVSSARGLLNASHQPASLWQGPCAYYSASSRCLFDKIAQPPPICQGVFEILHSPSCKTAGPQSRGARRSSRKNGWVKGPGLGTAYSPFPLQGRKNPGQPPPMRAHWPSYSPAPAKIQLHLQLLRRDTHSLGPSILSTLPAPGRHPHTPRRPGTAPC